MRRVEAWLVAALGVGVGTALWGQGEAQAQRELAEAQRRADAGDLAGALEEYESIARQWPEGGAGVEALSRLGWGRWATGDPPAAAAAARRLIELAPQAPQAAGARVLLGEITLVGPSATAAAEARDEFHRAWALYPRREHPQLEWRARGRTREGEVAMEQGELAQAAAAFLDVVEQEPRSIWRVRAAIDLADAFLERGEWPAAAEALQGAVADAATLGDEGRDDLVRARWRLAAIDRLRVRPAAGASRWHASRPVGAWGAKKPTAVAAAADGDLIVVDPGLEAALVLRGGEVAARAVARDLERPFWDARGVAWAPAGASLERPLGGAPETPRAAEPFKAVRAGAAGRDGYYLLTGRPEGIAVVSREWRLRKMLELPPRSDPVDLASDARGRLYVLDARAGLILAYDPDGFGPHQLVAGLDRPQALAADWLGGLYVLDRNGRVEVFDRDGTRLESVGPTLPGGAVLADPRDLAVDGAGRLYIADAELAAVVVVE